MTLQNFNINSYVRVRLTDRGRAELRRQQDEFHKHFPSLASAFLAFTEVDGWSRWQLWDLMSRLGPMLKMGLDPPFEMNIVIEIDEGSARP